MYEPADHARIIICTTLFLLTLLFAFRQAKTDSQRSLPSGKGVEKVEIACLTCHQADIIVEQHLEKRKWEREIEKMIRWGAVIPEADREDVLSYLVNHLGPITKGQSARGRTLPAGQGAEKVETACLICHEADIIVEQRLDRKKWEREVDKMIRWGAVVSPNDRQEIINYLANNFGSPGDLAEEKK